MREIPHMKTLLESMAHRQPAAKKWAIVVPSAWERTLAEILLRFADLGQVQMRFFLTEVDALTWIATDSAHPISPAQ